MATISQRISLEGTEEIRTKLLALGQAGERAFKQIQDAAAKPITDPAQINKTKLAIDQLVATTAKLGPQFQAVSTAAQQAGTAIGGVADQAHAVSQSTGTALISAATAFKVAAVGVVAAIAAITNALTKGAVDTGTAVAAQAEKIGLTIPQWLELRKAIGATTLSQEDFMSSSAKIAGLMEQNKDGIERLSETVTQQRVQVGGSEVVIRRMNSTLTKTSSEAAKAAAELSKLGVSANTMTTGDVGAALREVAESINRIPDATKRATAGFAAFGKNWQTIVGILRGAQDIDPLKASRELSAEDIAKTVKLKAAWQSLSDAIRATKDQIGAVFLDPALARAEWLTNLVDGARELFKTWTGLDEVKRRLFVEGLSGGPAETAFKIMIALGQQLAGIWNGVLVPAGAKLMATVRSLAGSFDGVSTSQVVAFFITAAAAAVALAVALKGIGFVLGPLATLFAAAFSPLGIILLALGAAVVLFWDKFKAAAQAALGLIPEELQQMKQALTLLFTGDFGGFWNLFSAAAISAFQRIKEAALQTDIGQEFLRMLRVASAGFDLLKSAANGTAAAINRVFGTELKGGDIGIILVLAQMTGALQALASIAVITGVAMNGIIRVAGLVVSAIGGVPAAVLLAATALALLINYLDPGVWEFYANTARDALALIAPLVTPITEAVRALTTSVGGGEGSKAWDIFRNAALTALNPIYGAVQAIVRLVNGLKGLLGIKPTVQTDAVQDLNRQLEQGKISLKQYEDQLKSLAAASTQTAIKVEGAANRIASASEKTKTPTLSPFLSPKEFPPEQGGTKQRETGFGPERVDQAKQTFAAIEQAAAETAARIQQLFRIDLTQVFTMDWSNIISNAFTAAQSVSSAFQNVDISSVLSAQIDALISKFNELAAAAARAASAAQSAGSGAPSGGEPPPMARGGLLGGRGTGTSDSNLAWVSRGEHIMPARAVRQPGVLSFLEALRRSGGNLRAVLDDMGRFALGGMVPRAMPAFAAGGLAGGMSNITIAFPGVPPISGLRASSDVVDQLHKAAALAQVRSGGRKPSRYS